MLGIGLLWSLFSSAAIAVDFHVSPTGNDQNNGSLATPWRTIQKAANAATPGSTVRVSPGVYSELVVVRVSGNSTQGSITFQGERGAILDRSRIPVSDGDTGMFDIDSQSFLKIRGFEIRNLRASSSSATPIGIHVRGVCSNIEITSNFIHNIINDIDADSNAHGIAVFGTGVTEATAITGLRITNNFLRNLKLGASEALVVNGNVNGFLFSGNRITNCNNIAIDAIGFEGTSVSPFDQARNGLISKNFVSQIDSRGNPAYGNARSADGIYVDGGRNITIDRNTVSFANIGIEVTSEQSRRFATDVSVTNNLVTNCHTTGLSLGGYDRLRGGTRNCVITGNTFRGNDTDGNGSGEVQLQSLVQNNTIQNNDFSATSQNILISNFFTTTAGNAINFNRYFAPGGPANSIWIWKNRTYDGFNAYQQASQNDLNSTFVP
jgi:hypothetical protein